MQKNRLNCLQILLKRRYDQSHLLIHLGKSGKVRHYLWDKHVSKECETLQDLGKSWSICCWRPLRTGQACIYEEWSWQGGSCFGQRNNPLDFLRLLAAPGPPPAQTWTPSSAITSTLCATHSLTSAHTRSSFCRNVFASFWQITCVCCLLSFSCPSFLFFTAALLPIHCNPPSCPDLTPACKLISEGMTNLTFHGETCTKDMHQKSLLPGFRIIVLDCLNIHPCFGYIWLTLVSSFCPSPNDISLLVCGEVVASAAFELDDQARWA